MPEIAIPDGVPSGPLRDYLVWLQKLHKDAGHPPSRTLAKILTANGITCTHTTVTRLFKQYPSNRELAFGLISHLSQNPLRRVTRTDAEWDEFYDEAERMLDQAKADALDPSLGVPRTDRKRGRYVEPPEKPFPIKRTLVEWGCGTGFETDDRAATYFAEIILAGPADWVMHTEDRSHRIEDMSEQATEDLFAHVKCSHKHFTGGGAEVHLDSMELLVKVLPKFLRGAFLFEVPTEIVTPKGYLEEFWDVLVPKLRRDEGEGYPEAKFATTCFVGPPDETPFEELIERVRTGRAFPTTGHDGHNFYRAVCQGVKRNPLSENWMTEFMAFSPWCP